MSVMINYGLSLHFQININLLDVLTVKAILRTNALISSYLNDKSNVYANIIIVYRRKVEKSIVCDGFTVMDSLMV